MCAGHFSGDEAVFLTHGEVPALAARAATVFAHTSVVMLFAPLPRPALYAVSSLAPCLTTLPPIAVIVKVLRPFVAPSRPNVGVLRPLVRPIVEPPGIVAFAPTLRP